MEAQWDNSDRFAAISQAIDRVPHSQVGIGLGFQLRHNPASCVHCKAQIAILELASIINIMELERSEGSVTVDN